MKAFKKLLSAGAAALTVTATVAASGTALAQGAGPRFAGLPRIIVPGSSIQQGAGVSLRAHTNIRVLNVNITPAAGPPYGGTFYETPASLACVYGLVAAASGCNPNVVTKVAGGGSKVVAIVDAFDYPTALADLEKYSKQFGLPVPNLQVVYATGTRPPQDGSGGWELEEALDISMAHALAPKAKIILVEAASNSNNDLMVAETKASALVAAAGGGEVSNSWGASEYLGETSYDKYFTTGKVVYFASSGDSPGTLYPAVSPNVVSVGGTSIGRNPTTGAYEYQVTWDQGGGGPSRYEPRPAYQNGIAAIVGTQRGSPDLAFDANPETGVWVYDSTPLEGSAGWWIVGGTSVASPAAAAIVNAAGGFAASSAAELKTVYAAGGIAADYLDVASGACGPYEGDPAAKGWDFCTGVGALLGLGGK